MKRCVIVGCAPISRYEKIKNYLCPNDFFIFCDGGLHHQNMLGVTPNLIVGDFDSHPEPNSSVETIVLPREKDDTDTVYAVKVALERGFENFLLVGVSGGRLDHTLGNVGILLMLYNKGKQAELLDDYSIMEIVGKEPISVSDDFLYFSLLSIFGTASGINISGAKYPLANAEITPEYQYGISNEVNMGENAKIWVEDGLLLLIKIYHE